MASLYEDGNLPFRSNNRHQHIHKQSLRIRQTKAHKPKYKNVRFRRNKNEHMQNHRKSNMCKTYKSHVKINLPTNTRPKIDKEFIYKVYRPTNKGAKLLIQNSSKLLTKAKLVTAESISLTRRWRLPATKWFMASLCFSDEA